MSASLVGSEMCIRDRLWSDVTPNDNWARVSESTSRDGDLISMPRNLKAVSYTHLTLPTICSV
eukprot:5461375-Alexandrium_andersonii.AAC.1